MIPSLLFFFLLASASALPDYDKGTDQEIVVDVIKNQLISYPANLEESQTAEAFIIGNTVRKMIDDAIRNIPNPIPFEDQRVFLYFGSDLTIAASARGVHFTDVNNVKIETLRVSWLIPMFARVKIEVVLPETYLHIDWVQKIIRIKGIPYVCTIKGRIAIKRSTVQVTAVVNAISKKILSLNTDFKFGHFHSSLEGSVNGINVKRVIDAVITDVVPEILDNKQDEINEYFNHLISELV